MTRNGIQMSYFEKWLDTDFYKMTDSKEDSFLMDFRELMRMHKNSFTILSKEKSNPRKQMVKVMQNHRMILKMRILTNTNQSS